MGAIRLPLYVIVLVSLFTRNTLRDVPYGCSTVPHPVRNVALPVPVGSKSVAVTICCMGKIIYAEHPKGFSLPFQKTAYIVSRETVQFAILYIATIRLLW